MKIKVNKNVLRIFLISKYMLLEKDPIDKSYQLFNPVAAIS